MTKTEVIKFRTDQELAERIKRGADRRGMAVSALIRYAVIWFLDNQEKTDEQAD